MESRIIVRMSDGMIAQIELWIASQSGYVSRQEAVRWLVALSLEQIDPPASSVRGPQDGVQRADGRRKSVDADP